MKFKRLSMYVALALAIFAISCRPDAVNPRKGGKGDIGQSWQDTWTPSNACQIGHAGPIPECTQRLSMDLVNAVTLADQGQIYWVSGPDAMFCLIYPNTGVLIREAYVYIGEVGILPPMIGNDFDFLNFPYRCIVPAPGRSPLVVIVPLDRTFQCNTVAVRAKMVKTVFGGTQTTTFWGALKPPTAPPNPAADYVGTYCQNTWLCPQYCPGYCGFQGNASCPPVVTVNCAAQAPVLELDCSQNCATQYLGFCAARTSTFTATIVNADSNLTYSYFWTPGNQTTASITVSPEDDATYTVTVIATDANNISSEPATCTYTVNVIDIRAGSKGDKVLVCYSPPSQPGVWIQKAVKPKYVGRYVPALRYGSTACLGTGSGSGSNKSGSIKSDSSGSNKSGSIKSGSNKSGSIKSGSNKPGSIKSGSKIGSIKSGSIKSGSIKSGSIKSGSGSIKSGSVKSGSGSGGGIGTLNGYLGPCGFTDPCTGYSTPNATPKGSNKSGSVKSGSSGSVKSGSVKSIKVPSVKVPSVKPPKVPSVKPPKVPSVKKPKAVKP